MKNLYFLIILILVSRPLYAKNEITWIKNNAEPFYILEGEYKNQGFGDKIENLIRKEITEYQHLTMEAPLKRVLKYYRDKKDICFSTWIYNTKKDLVYTSLPYVQYYPFGFIIHKDNSNRFLESNLISTLNNKKLTLGLPSGRGYGKQLEKIISPFKKKDHIIIRHGNDSTRGIFNMITSKRILYSYEYPFVYQYLKTKYDKDNITQFIPSGEKENIGQLGAISCTHSKWGEKTIDRINQAIKKIVKTPEYKKVINKWIAKDKKYWTKRSKTLNKIINNHDK